MVYRNIFAYLVINIFIISSIDNVVNPKIAIVIYCASFSNERVNYGATMALFSSAQISFSQKGSSLQL